MPDQHSGTRDAGGIQYRIKDLPKTKPARKHSSYIAQVIDFT